MDARRCLATSRAVQSISSGGTAWPLNEVGIRQAPRSSTEKKCTRGVTVARVCRSALAGLRTCSLLQEHLVPQGQQMPNVFAGRRDFEILHIGLQHFDLKVWQSEQGPVG